LIKAQQETGKGSGRGASGGIVQCNEGDCGLWTCC
jgi:hypothetical protein